MISDLARKPQGGSLKLQLTLLGVLSSAVLLITAFVTYQLLQGSESSVVAYQARQLDRVADQVTQQYHRLLESLGQDGTPSPLAARDALPLNHLLDVALAEYPGVEGGFYVPLDNQLIGYSYPTYEGTGRKSDIPTAERATILQVARQAAATGQPAHETIRGGRDIILFAARPLRDSERVVGSAWLMHRLVNVRSSNRGLYTFGIAGLLLTSILVTLGAFAIVRSVTRKVEDIETGLQTLEQSLSHEMEPTGSDEFDRIVHAINRLAQTLRQNLEIRAQLEADLGQAEKLSALGRLVASVAHEVRNPLASIKLKVQLCQRSLENQEKLATNFQVILAEIRRLDRLVERLLLIAKPVQLHLTAVDLNLFVRERLEVFRGLADERGIALEFEPGELPNSVPLDKERFGQVIDNLVSNAIEAIHGSDGSVLVATAPSAEGLPKVALSVSDNGNGISVAEAERIFEPFYTTKEGGTGLGLYLTSEIVRAHGGIITFSKRRGGGMTFTVTLP